MKASRRTAWGVRLGCVPWGEGGKRGGVLEHCGLFICWWDDDGLTCTNMLLPTHPQVIKETSALTFMIAGTVKEVVTGGWARGRDGYAVQRRGTQ